MSELRRIAFGLVGVLFAAGIAGAQARANDSTLDARYRAAVSRLQELRRREAAYFDERMREAPPKALAEGLVTIHADTAAVGAAEEHVLRDAARRASEAIVKVHGIASGQTVGSVEFVAAPMDQGPGVRRIRLRVRGWTIGGDHEIWLDPPVETSRVETYLEDIAATVATAKLDPDLSAWWTVPGSTPTPQDWQQLAIWLYGAASTVTHRCLQGNIEECSSTLGLRPEVNQLDRFYTPEDYPSLVEHQYFGRPIAEADTAIKSCVTTRNAAACKIAAHRERPGDGIPRSVRGGLFAMALEIGGDGALNRLFGAHGAAREQLALAAGIPADSLIGRWRARVEASRPSHAVTMPALATMMWAGVLVFFARRRPLCA